MAGVRDVTATTKDEVIGLITGRCPTGRSRRSCEPATVGRPTRRAHRRGIAVRPAGRPGRGAATPSRPGSSRASWSSRSSSPSINGAFASSGNLIELFRSATLYFIVACASTLVLVGGGLDFSIGAVYALGAVVAGLLMTHGVPWPLALLGGIAVGVVVGLINAAVIGLPRRAAADRHPRDVLRRRRHRRRHHRRHRRLRLPERLHQHRRRELGGIPYLIFYAVIIGVMFHVLLERTVFGYNTEPPAATARAAAANGIRVARLDIALYAISGGVAALAGILGAARLSTASPSAGGASLTFQVVTAVIIGGTSLFGGIGTIAGSALGAILFAEINNGLQVINVNPLYQNIFIGVILVAAVAIDQYRRRRRYRT